MLQVDSRQHYTDDRPTWCAGPASLVVLWRRRRGDFFVDDLYARSRMASTRLAEVMSSSSQNACFGCDGGRQTDSKETRGGGRR